MKVAIVGSGVSGLAATWLLNEHSDHEVHLYEADDRPGGHANTVRFYPDKESKKGIDVDTGFIVFNPSTYPNFLRFLKLHPKIPIAQTEMTFSISRNQGDFEWKGDTLFTVFCQPRRVLDPGMWRMIYDILRFNASAKRLIMRWKAQEGNRESRDGEDVVIADYLEREGYSREFQNNYLIPMTAAIWSTPPTKTALSFPFRTLVQFMHNHHLLQLTGKPSWLTIPGGSGQYVNEILKKLPKTQLHLSTPISSLTTLEGSGTGSTKVFLTTGSGKSETFDHVIMACHSDETLKILKAGGLSRTVAIEPDADAEHASVVTSNNSESTSSSRSSSPLPSLSSDSDSVSTAFDDDSGVDVSSKLKRGPGTGLGTEDPNSSVVGGITPEEEEILSIFQWNRNECVLHNDPRLMPKRRMAWGCWNYLGVPTEDGSEMDRVCLIDGMNDLQHISLKEYGPVLVTLNAPPELQPLKNTVRGRWKYDHPVLDQEAVRAQKSHASYTRNSIHLIRWSVSQLWVPRGWVLVWTFGCDQVCAQVDGGVQRNRYQDAFQNRV
ncbi:hypothetical protein D9758_016824 [Tetrapyrgos nigripes]|uniref:Amine oxidase domain-containing protein n=1 Tax=Tetrapyrgos nigripes TaxID=182062 RepID=A0A8H5BV42_9AGAR|nr:hypothetical protein D9758_016824 [Tetrapyrgos nigripes]